MEGIKVLPTTDRCWGDTKKIAGQKHKWYSTDSQVNYNQNCHEHPRVMEFWKDKEVFYDFNKYGFRSPELTKNDNNILFLGCSHTAGIGLPVENTFPHIIASELGMNLCNFGAPGASNDTCYRLGSFWIPILKPKVVVYKTVEKHRCEIKMYGNSTLFWHGFHPNKDNSKVGGTDLGDYFNQWVTNEENTDLNRNKNLDAIETVCNRVGAKFFVMAESRYGWDAGNEDLIKKARDLQHPGIEENKDMAMEMLGKMGELR